MPILTDTINRTVHTVNISDLYPNHPVYPFDILIVKADMPGQSFALDDLEYNLSDGDECLLLIDGTDNAVDFDTSGMNSHGGLEDATVSDELIVEIYMLNGSVKAIVPGA